METNKKASKNIQEIVALVLMFVGFVALIVGIALTYSYPIAVMVGGAILLTAGVVADWRS